MIPKSRLSLFKPRPDLLPRKSILRSGPSTGQCSPREKANRHPRFSLLCEKSDERTRSAFMELKPSWAKAESPLEEESPSVIRRASSSLDFPRQGSESPKPRRTSMLSRNSLRSKCASRVTNRSFLSTSSLASSESPNRPCECV